MSDVTLKALLLGQDESAGRAFKGVGDAAEDAADRGEKAFSGLGDKLKGFAAGAVGGLALGELWSASMDFTAGNAKMNAQLGLTEQQSAQAGKVAGSLYAQNYGTGIDQIHEAISSVVQNIDGMRTASSATLTDISGKALNTANIFDQDLGGVTKAVSQMMRTGLAKNADEAFDVITSGFQRGADKADDFLDTLNEYGTQFRKLGLDGQTATGLLSQGLKAGARDGDLVADALKEFSIRAVDGSKTTSQGFKQLGLDGKKMAEDIAAGGPKARKGLDVVLDRLRAIKDPVKQGQIAVGLFGTQAEDLGKALYALDPSKAADGLGKVAGSADKANKAFNDTPSAEMGEFFRQVSGWAVNIIGGQLIPGLEHVGKFYKDHKTLINDLVIVTVAVVAITKAHAIATGIEAAGGLLKYLSATKLVTAASKTWAAIQWLLNAALNANPIGIVILVLAALAAGIIYAYKHSETFRNIVDGAFKAVGTAISFLWNNIAKPYFKFLIDAWMAVAGAIIHGAANAFGWVPGLGGKLKTAADKFDDFRDQVNASLDGIHDKTITVTVKQKQKYTNNNGPGSADQDSYNLTGKHKHNARGTSWWEGGLTEVNEEGPEIIDLPTGTRIYPAGLSSRMAGNGGSDPGYVVVIVKNESGEVLEEKLVRVKKDRGGQPLGFED